MTGDTIFETYEANPVLTFQYFKKCSILGVFKMDKNSKHYRVVEGGKVNKARKKTIWILCIVAVLAGLVFAAIRIYENISLQREEDAIMAQKEIEIREAYLRVNILHSVDEGLSVRFQDRRYAPLRDILPAQNEWGICVARYLLLKMYEKETGKSLSYETLLDFFSQEFETDGSLRLYNNGNHPEIQAFIEWIWESEHRRDEFGEYANGRILAIYSDYVQEHRNQGFEHSVWWQLSPQMLDALARAEADPDYVLDLTSLQQAGY